MQNVNITGTKKDSSMK